MSCIRYTSPKGRVVFISGGVAQRSVIS